MTLQTTQSQMAKLASQYRSMYHVSGAAIDWEQRNEHMRSRIASGRPRILLDRLPTRALVECLGSLAEPAYREVATGALVCDYLLSMGYKVSPLTGARFEETETTFPCPDTEVIAGDIDRARVVFRVDLDAVVFAREDIRHACGHSVNMAAVLKVAENMADLQLTGDVAFVFQPAEEGAGNAQLTGYQHVQGFGGGQYLRQKGLFARIDTMLSCHIDTSLKPNEVRITPAIATAAGYRIDYRGRGVRAHAALPQEGINPVDGMLRFLQEMYRLNERFRTLTSNHYGLVTITQVGTSRCDLNTLAEEAEAHGIGRIVGAEAADLLKDSLRRVGATCELEAPPVVNDSQLASRAQDVARRVGFEVKIEPARFRDETAWAGPLGVIEPASGETPPGARRVLHMFVSGGPECGPLHSERFSGSVESADWQAKLLTAVARSILSS